MIEFYERFAAVARRLIAEKGAALTFTRVTTTPSSDGATSGTSSTIEFVCRAVGVPAGPSDQFRAGSLEGRRVHRLYVASATVMPTMGDLVTWQGTPHAVKNATSYTPDNGTLVLSDILIEAM